LALVSGLRLPGIWDPFEAGVRAILGQQVSIKAARNLLCSLVDNKGIEGGLGKILFPDATVLNTGEFDFLKMPASRKSTLKNLATFCLMHGESDDLSHWLSIKGIGPWTVDYAKMRGQSNPDIYLGGDLGIKKVFAKFDGLDTENCAPFRSYLTFQLWCSL
jgi:AraC family transcriptional regulator of adaptative response / DNA-3-methyladenine glycosylase II